MSILYFSTSLFDFETTLLSCYCIFFPYLVGYSNGILQYLFDMDPFAQTLICVYTLIGLINFSAKIAPIRVSPNGCRHFFADQFQSAWICVGRQFLSGQIAN